MGTETTNAAHQHRVSNTKGDYHPAGDCEIKSRGECVLR